MIYLENDTPDSWGNGSRGSEFLPLAVLGKLLPASPFNRDFFPFLLLVSIINSNNICPHLFVWVLYFTISGFVIFSLDKDLMVNRLKGQTRGDKRAPLNSLLSLLALSTYILPSIITAETLVYISFKDIISSLLD